MPLCCLVCAVIIAFQLFARAGYSICLYDISDEQLQGAKEAIRVQLEGLQGEGLLREGQTASQLLTAVSFSSNLKDAVTGVDYIQVSTLDHHPEWNGRCFVIKGAPL